MDDLNVYCWGPTWAGTTDNLVPTLFFTSDVAFSQLVVGYNHACGLRPDGQVNCWGHNEHGQLGDNTTANSITTPVAVNTAGLVAVDTFFTKFLYLIAGKEFTCGIEDTNGTGSPGARGYLACWGKAGPWFALGSSLPATDQLRPTIAGGYSFCGSGNCNPSGTSAGFFPGSNQPRIIIDGDKVASDGVGEVCGVGQDNYLHCWGNEAGTRNGTGGTSDWLGASTGLNDVGSVQVGTQQACITRASDSTVACTGLQANTYYAAGLPSQAVTDLRTGSFASCGRISGDLQCWGKNTGGALGFGTISTASLAAAPTDLRDGIEPQASFAGACALDADRKLYCWGYNGSRRLADQTTTNSGNAVLIPLPY